MNLTVPVGRRRRFCSESERTDQVACELLSRDQPKMKKVPSAVPYLLLVGCTVHWSACHPLEEREAPVEAELTTSGDGGVHDAGDGGDGGHDGGDGGHDGGDGGHDAGDGGPDGGDAGDGGHDAGDGGSDAGDGGDGGHDAGDAGHDGGSDGGSDGGHDGGDGGGDGGGSDGGRDGGSDGGSDGGGSDGSSDGGGRDSGPPPPPPDAGTGDSGPPDSGPPPMCYQQDIQQNALTAGSWPQIEVSSPYSDSTQFTAVHGSLHYYVDMPYSSSEPYYLGMGGDLDGWADICTYTDPATNEEYDQITLHLNWAADSGAAYNVYYDYTPYEVGVGSTGAPVAYEYVYLVDAASGWDMNCLAGSAEEHIPINSDLNLTPSYYIGTQDRYAMWARGAYVPWVAIGGVPDIITQINTKYATTGTRLIVNMISHGWTDIWWIDGTQNLAGNNANVRALGAGANGHVARMNFESCCTAKGFNYGMAPNVIASLSAALTAPGDPATQICGWNHSTFSWFRRQAFHYGHTKYDFHVCGP
jgi:hypothetical protein